jgi:hypothetical protein
MGRARLLVELSRGRGVVRVIGQIHEFNSAPQILRDGLACGSLDHE